MCSATKRTKNSFRTFVDRRQAKHQIQNKETQNKHQPRPTTMKPKGKLHFSLECVCRLNMATAPSAHNTENNPRRSSLTLELLCMEMDLNIFSPFVSIGVCVVLFVFLKTQTESVCVCGGMRSLSRQRRQASPSTSDVSQFGKWYCDSCSCSSLAAVFLSRRATKDRRQSERMT